jgi:hypothetical protein
MNLLGALVGDLVSGNAIVPEGTNLSELTISCSQPFLSFRKVAGQL